MSFVSGHFACDSGAILTFLLFTREMEKIFCMRGETLASTEMDTLVVCGVKSLGSEDSTLRISRTDGRLTALRVGIGMACNDRVRDEIPST